MQAYVGQGNHGKHRKSLLKPQEHSVSILS